MTMAKRKHPLAPLVRVRRPCTPVPVDLKPIHLQPVEGQSISVEKKTRESESPLIDMPFGLVMKNGV
jgi:hypothetical protein